MPKSIQVPASGPKMKARSACTQCTDKCSSAGSDGIPVSNRAQR